MKNTIWEERNTMVFGHFWTHSQLMTLKLKRCTEMWIQTTTLDGTGNLRIQITTRLLKLMILHLTGKVGKEIIGAFWEVPLKIWADCSAVVLLEAEAVIVGGAVWVYHGAAVQPPAPAHQVGGAASLALQASQTIRASLFNRQALFNRWALFSQPNPPMEPNLLWIPLTTIQEPNQLLLILQDQWMSTGLSKARPLMWRNKANAEAAGASAPMESLNLTFWSRAVEEWTCQNNNLLIANVTDVSAAMGVSKTSGLIMPLKMVSWLRISILTEVSNKSAVRRLVHTRFQNILTFQEEAKCSKLWERVQLQEQFTSMMDFNFIRREFSTDASRIQQTMQLWLLVLPLITGSSETHGEPIGEKRVTSEWRETKTTRTHAQFKMKHTVLLNEFSADLIFIETY